MYFCKPSSKKMTSALLLTLTPSPSCHNYPGKNLAIIAKCLVSRTTWPTSFASCRRLLSLTRSTLRRKGYPTRQRSKPKTNEGRDLLNGPTTASLFGGAVTVSQQRVCSRYIFRQLIKILSTILRHKSSDHNFCHA